MDLPLTTAGEFGRLGNPGLFGAVILAAVASALAAAAFGILFSKLQISRFRRRRTLVRLPSFCSSGEEEEEEEDEDASISSCDTGTEDGDETDEMEERDDVEEEDEDDDDDESGDFRGAKVNGMGNFSFSSFSLADLVEGMGVVKAWDGMRLGFGGSRGEIFGSFNGRSAQFLTGATLAWPEETDHRRGAVVRVWDARAGDDAPVTTTRPMLEPAVVGVRVRDGREGIRRR